MLRLYLFSQKGRLKKRMGNSSKKTDLLYQNDEDKNNQIQIGKTPVSDGRSAGNILPQILNLDISNHEVISEAETISRLFKKNLNSKRPFLSNPIQAQMHFRLR